MLEFTSCSKHIIENSIGNDHFITNVVSETNKDFLSTNNLRLLRKELKEEEHDDVWTSW